jgi:hypothetical protein
MAIGINMGDDVRSDDEAYANSDIYYKGRRDQEKIDKDFYEKVTKENREELLSFLKELRSETLSDADGNRRWLVEKITKYVLSH